MRKLLLTSVALIALTGAANAQCPGGGAPVQYGTCTSTSSASGCDASGSYATVTDSPDESALASWAARKAVEHQQSTWWDETKVDKLTREQLDARTERLNALQRWARGLSNHIFGEAYVQWANDRLSELARRRITLDQLDVALSLVKGLPTPPADAR